MVTCISPSPPLKTKSRRGTPILFEERGGCIQATNWLKLVALPLETSTLKRVQPVLYATSPPFLSSLFGLRQPLSCINVPNQIKIVFCAIREVKHCLNVNRETAGCRVKFCPASFFFFLINVKARPTTNEKRVFRKRDPWKFDHLFSAFWCQHFTMVCCEQWKRTIPSCKYAYVTNPLIIFFYIINPAIKTFLHKNLFIF